MRMPRRYKEGILSMLRFVTLACILASSVTLHAATLHVIDGDKVLLDGEPSRYRGRGVLKAVENVNTIVRPALLGRTVTEQRKIDMAMLDLDGTPNKAMAKTPPASHSPQKPGTEGRAIKRQIITMTANISV